MVQFIAWVSIVHHTPYPQLTHSLQCQNKWPILCRFEDGWPIRNILVGYLVNQEATKNRKIKQLKAAGISTKVFLIID